MSYEFRVVPHSILPGLQMVECWRDGEFVAGVYPHQDGIRVVSKFMTAVTKETHYPPSIIIKLETRYAQFRLQDMVKKPGPAP